MRIVEIASAEEQLALWKLISDSIWTTIGQQARAEAQQKANATAQAAQAALKPKKPKKPKKLPKPILPAKPKPPSPKTNNHPKPQSPVPQRAVSRPGPLPSRHVPLPSSQPVLPPVRSTAFSQADLHKIQSTMPGQAPGASSFPVSN